jgi:hypothetical protein
MAIRVLIDMVAELSFVIVVADPVREIGASLEVAGFFVRSWRCRLLRDG